MIKYVPFLYIFVHSKSFLKILPSFNLLRSLELKFLDLYFQEYLAAINFLCFKSCMVENLSKYRHFLKNITRVEIIITISTAILIKNNKKL